MSYVFAVTKEIRPLTPEQSSDVYDYDCVVVIGTPRTKTTWELIGCYTTLAKAAKAVGIRKSSFMGNGKIWVYASRSIHIEIRKIPVNGGG